MATSAFKSTTKRSSLGIATADEATSTGTSVSASSSNRRSRSLSRAPSLTGKFVNTVRGSEFPEISIDDEDNFPLKLKDERASSEVRRRSVTSPSTAAQRRGRSVSRPHSRAIHDFDGDGSGKGYKTTSSSSSTSGFRRRSASVARYQFSDSESEDHSHKYNFHANVKSCGSWNHRKPSLNKPATFNHQRVLKRSLSQKDLSKSCDGYSSHSSALTDEEVRDTQSTKNESDRTIRAGYSQKKTEHPIGDGVATGLYEVMRQELRHAVEDIRTEIEQGIMHLNHSVLADDDSLQSNNSNVLQAVTVIRKNYTAKLEQSEKRKQDLLAEIAAEEQRGRELCKIVNELLPDPKNTAAEEKSSLGGKSDNRSWMSKCLTEDAEKYFDDFLSNVEDTDISSFDGERSDASSTVGVKKPRDLVQHFRDRETAGHSRRSTCFPVEMDGVVLPWLQWETSNDDSPQLHNIDAKVPLIAEDNSCSSAQDERAIFNGGSIITTSYGNSSPQGSMVLGDSRIGDLSQSIAKKPYIDMEEYIHIERSEQVIVEAYRQRRGISSGTVLLCTASFY